MKRVLVYSGLFVVYWVIGVVLLAVLNLPVYAVMLIVTVVGALVGVYLGLAGVFR